MAMNARNLELSKRKRSLTCSWWLEESYIWRKRVGVEPFRVWQTKDLLLESTASPDEYLNFRPPLAHEPGI
jgi:hypothetical protein